MSFNSSSSSNTSLPPHVSSSNSSISPASLTCFNYGTSVFIFTIFSITYILLLLPLCILVLYLGVQRWRRQRTTPASHSDIFTYNMVAMEMIGIVGCGLCCCAVRVNAPSLMTVGGSLFSAATIGQVLFHILTCVERYLAVVHPITYQGLRERGGVRIRNVIIGCVWLSVIGLVGLAVITSSIVTFVCVSILSVVVILFSSLTVLRALIRPGPGEGGGNRKRVDRSKMKGFYIIMTTLGALLFRLGVNLLVSLVYASLAASKDIRCMVVISGVWFSLPSSLVLPLLFLHRAGKRHKDHSRAP